MQGILNAELNDLSIPVTDAVFSKSGESGGIQPGPETADVLDETITAWTWYDISEPMLIHTYPNVGPDARPYGVCTVLIPALGAQGNKEWGAGEGHAVCEDAGRGRPFSNCALAFCESWTENRCSSNPHRVHEKAKVNLVDPEGTARVVIAPAHTSTDAPTSTLPRRRRPVLQRPAEMPRSRIPGRGMIQRARTGQCPHVGSDRFQHFHPPLPQEPGKCAINHA